MSNLVVSPMIVSMSKQPMCTAHSPRVRSSSLFTNLPRNKNEGRRRGETIRPFSTRVPEFHTVLAYSYIEGLENRIEKLEKLLKRVCPPLHSPLKITLPPKTTRVISMSYCASGLLVFGCDGGRLTTLSSSDKVLAVL